MNYECPVCKKMHATLDDLSMCISVHQKNEKMKEEKKKEQEVTNLMTKNNQLVAELKENCDKLKKYGYNCVLDYSVNKNSNKPTSKTSNPKTATVKEIFPKVTKDAEKELLEDLYKNLITIFSIDK